MRLDGPVLSSKPGGNPWEPLQPANHRGVLLLLLSFLLEQIQCIASTERGQIGGKVLWRIRGDEQQSGKVRLVEPSVFDRSPSLTNSSEAADRLGFDNCRGAVASQMLLQSRQFGFAPFEQVPQRRKWNSLRDDIRI
jgi:hypothetical protein